MAFYVFTISVIVRAHCSHSFQNKIDNILKLITKNLPCILNLCVGKHIRNLYREESIFEGQVADK